MKKCIIASIATIMFVGCAKEGEIRNMPSSVYNINGKLYQFVEITPADNRSSVWILVPKDSTAIVPLVTKYSYTTKSGKSNVTHHINVITIPSK